MMKGIGKNRNRLNGMNDGIGLLKVLTVLTEILCLFFLFVSAS